MCLYQTFLDLAGNNIERKMWDSPKCKNYTKPVHVYNNNNSYIALYHLNIYKLAALYIINIKIRLTIQKCTSTINAYINIKMTKKPGWNKNIIKAFYTHRNNHKYYKIMHILISTWQSEKHKYCHLYICVSLSIVGTDVLTCSIVVLYSLYWIKEKD